MEGILHISTQSHERNIKFTKKMLRGQMLLVGFNISLLSFNWFILIDSPSIFTSFAFGAMAVTVLWSVIFLLETWGELRTEKLHLKFLTELEHTQMASGEREQYINARKHYEQLIEDLKEKQDDQGT